MHYVRAGIYVILWTIILSASALFSAILLEDYGFFLVTIGAVLGLLFGICTRSWHILHRVFIPFGFVAAACLYRAAIEIASARNACVGRDGPLVGLGEIIFSLILYAYIVLALLVSLSGVIGMGIRGRSSHIAD